MFRHTVNMEFDAAQRRQALQAFMEREGLKPAPWEKQAKIGDGTVRKFLAGQSGTLTDRTYHALATAAGVMRGRLIALAELQGASVASPTQSNHHEIDMKARQALRLGDTPPPPLVLFKTEQLEKSRGGGFMLSVQPAGEVERPDFLRYSAKAFAAKVLDDNNAPAYRKRDVILVDPESPSIEDEDCCFAGDITTDGGALAVIGCLISSTATTWKVRQYAVKGERDLGKADFPNAWPIVGRYNRR